jgi:serine phosphatase RsbU (regulator of sigma subunit)
MLTTLLPRKIATSPYRVLWLAVLLLAPLAYVAGGLLYLKTNPNAQIQLVRDRQQTLADAVQYLNLKGLNTNGWKQYCIAENRDDLHSYYGLTGNPARQLVSRFYPSVVLKVLLRKPDDTEAVEVFFAPDGRPVGFDRKLWQVPTSADLTPAAAQTLAEAALRARPEAGVMQLAAAPQVEETSIRGNLTRRFIWQWQLPQTPELKAHTAISVHGNEVTAEVVEAKLDNSFIQQHLRESQGVKIASQVCFWLVLIIALLFGIYRFTKRARQKEISYPRIFLITGFVATVLNLFVVLSDMVIYQPALLSREAVPAWIIYVSAGLVWVLMALFLGLAYGSGEGDIREAYPGKLTSIDAMIVGKFFSRNVARSVVWGSALGGWLMLVIHLAWWYWHRQPGAGESLLPFVIYYAELPLLLVFTSWQTDVALICVIGLLLPLPFLRRRFQPERRLGRWAGQLAHYLPHKWTENWLERCMIACLALFAWVASQEPQLGFRPWTGILVLAALKTFFLLLAFFKFDLLTAGFALALPLYLKFALTAFIQPAQAIHSTGVVALGCIAALLLTELFFAFRGRWFRDEEVRPIYAKNLAERLSLQAEVSAARVAQERLLPQSLPMASSFTVAASCLPAREVGGDFYDFFEMGPQQIGILVAEGGGRGLGAALTIAYAKGFLMPKLSGLTSNDDSPTEVLRGLQEKLSQMLAHDDAIGLAFAVLDTGDGVLRYARTGQFPQLRLGRATRKVTLTTAEEHEIRFTTRSASGPGSPETISIIEGRAELDEGDQVVIYTGGLVDTWENNKRAPADELTQLLTKAAQATSSEDLQASLVQSVKHCFKLGQKQELEDDLTAVLVRVEQLGPLAEAASSDTR